MRRVLALWSNWKSVWGLLIYELSVRLVCGHAEGFGMLRAREAVWVLEYQAASGLSIREFAKRCSLLELGLSSLSSLWELRRAWPLPMFLCGRSSTYSRVVSGLVYCFRGWERLLASSRIGASSINLGEFSKLSAVLYRWAPPSLKSVRHISFNQPLAVSWPGLFFVTRRGFPCGFRAVLGFLKRERSVSWESGNTAGLGRRWRCQAVRGILNRKRTKNLESIRADK